MTDIRWSSRLEEVEARAGEATKLVFTYIHAPG